MGLNGCVGSMDGVHVEWGKCPVAWNAFCCGKEEYPTLVFNVTVSHSGRVLSVTKSFWGARNDKTIVRYDQHIMNIKNNKIYDDVVFELYNEKGELVKKSGKAINNVSFN